MYTMVCKTSPLSGKQNVVAIPLAPDVYAEAYIAWRDGSLIQDAFPTLTDPDREFVKTGITAEEWDQFIGDED